MEESKENIRSPLRIFLSSSFKDLEKERKSLLKRIERAFNAIGMELFVANGEPSQKDALDELLKSDVVIFLISSYYGTNIDSCVYKDKCKAECGMKTGKEKISYTWCEYRFARAEGKAHMTYIVNDKSWPSKDGSENSWKFRNEVEKIEFCPRIESKEIEEGKIIKDLASNIVKWYSNNEIKLRDFCGRRKYFKELFDKLKDGGSIEVYGIGGIGKTALCESVLYLYKMLGNKVVYVGSKEAYASGNGYIGASKILEAQRFKSLSLDNIIDALGLESKIKEVDMESKIENILSKIESESIILFIDDIREEREGNELTELNELIKNGNNLKNGSILVTSKKEIGIAQIRFPLKSNEEPEELVKIMADRLIKKTISAEQIEKIKDIAEGHPIATYLLVSNSERLGIETLRNFKEGLDFSRDSDVKEYINRVIKEAISEASYIFLENVSIISNFNPIEMDVLIEASPEIRENMSEVIDANIMRREGNKLFWELNQLQEALFKDIPERYHLAHRYFQKRYEKYKEKDDKIKALICECEIDYKPDIYEQFKNLYNSMEPTEQAYELLPLLAEEIIKHIEKKEDKAEASLIAGDIYNKLSEYKERALNSKKAISAYEEALKVYTLDRFPMDYAMTQNGLGTAYVTLANVESKVENCKKAISAFKEALKVRTLGRFPEDYAMTQNNLGNAYVRLAEVESPAENCKKAISAYEEALKVYTLGRFPEDYAMTQNNLGNAYGTLAEVESTAENCKKAINAFKKALDIYTSDRSPMQYAATQNNLGIVYNTLAEVASRAENCKKAINAFKKALDIYTPDRFPMQYAKAQNGLGIAYNTLAEVESKAENCKKATSAFKEALKVFTEKEFREIYSSAILDIKKILDFCRKDK